jgi:hypothetical protein
MFIVRIAFTSMGNMYEVGLRIFVCKGSLLDEMWSMQFSTGTGSSAVLWGLAIKHCSPPQDLCASWLYTGPLFCSPLRCCGCILVVEVLIMMCTLVFFWCVSVLYLMWCSQSLLWVRLVLESCILGLRSRSLAGKCKCVSTTLNLAFHG